MIDYIENCESVFWQHMALLAFMALILGFVVLLLKEIKVNNKD